MRGDSIENGEKDSRKQPFTTTINNRKRKQFYSGSLSVSGEALELWDKLKVPSRERSA